MRTQKKAMFSYYFGTCVNISISLFPISWDLQQDFSLHSSRTQHFQKFGPPALSSTIKGWIVIDFPPAFINALLIWNKKFFLRRNKSQRKKMIKKVFWGRLAHLLRPLSNGSNFGFQGLSSLDNISWTTYFTPENARKMGFLAFWDPRIRRAEQGQVFGFTRQGWCPGC